MFTGIVECVGTLQEIKRQGKGAHVRVKATKEFMNGRVALGDSIATDGVCLTATHLHEDGYEADLSFESFNLTTFQYMTQGQKVNLELACTPHTRLGGHIMQGHVDGMGMIIDNYQVDEARNIWIKAPENLKRYIAMKGSIAINGVSLTVNEVRDCDFRLTLIAHTQGAIASEFRVGERVNLEVDVLARYLERLLNVNAKDGQKSSNVTLDMLSQNGFM